MAGLLVADDSMLEKRVLMLFICLALEVCLGCCCCRPLLLFLLLCGARFPTLITTERRYEYTCPLFSGKNIIKEERIGRQSTFTCHPS